MSCNSLKQEMSVQLGKNYHSVRLLIGEASLLALVVFKSLYSARVRNPAREIGTSCEIAAAVCVSQFALCPNATIAHKTVIMQ